MLVDLDDAVTGQVQVVAGIPVGPVHMVVQREGEHERAVDAAGVECLQQLTHIGGLTRLVPGIVTVQPDRPVLVVLDDLQTESAPIAGTLVAGCAELGDRDRLSLRDQATDTVGESVGDPGRPIEIHGHDVEGCPVDPLKRHRGVGHLAAEALADQSHGRAEEFVDTCAGLADLLPHAIRPAQRRDPLVGAVTWQEPRIHQAQLGAGDEHHFGSPPPQPLRAFGAVREQRQHLLGGQFEGVRS